MRLVAWAWRRPWTYRLSGRLARWLQRGQFGGDGHWSERGPGPLAAWAAGRQVPVLARRSFRERWRDLAAEPTRRVAGSSRPAEARSRTAEARGRIRAREGGGARMTEQEFLTALARRKGRDRPMTGHAGWASARSLPPVCPDWGVDALWERFARELGKLGGTAYRAGSRADAGEYMVRLAATLAGLPEDRGQGAEERGRGRRSWCSGPRRGSPGGGGLGRPGGRSAGVA